jgi:hypothetical protein
MNLLTQLVPQVERVTPETKKRHRWHRKPSKAERDARDKALTENIRQKLAAWDAEQAQEQNELLAKSAELPAGIRVVAPDTGAGQ